MCNSAAAAARQASLRASCSGDTLAGSASASAFRPSAPAPRRNRGPSPRRDAGGGGGKGSKAVVGESRGLKRQRRQAQAQTLAQARAVHAREEALAKQANRVPRTVCEELRADGRVVMAVEARLAVGRHAAHETHANSSGDGPQLAHLRHRALSLRRPQDPRERGAARSPATGGQRRAQGAHEGVG